MSNQAYNFNHVSQVVSLTTDDLPIQPTSHSFNGTQSANEDDGSHGKVKNNVILQLNNRRKYINTNIKQFFTFKTGIHSLKDTTFDCIENCHIHLTNLEKLVVILFFLRNGTYYIGLRVNLEEKKELDEARLIITEAILDTLNKDDIFLKSPYRMNVTSFDNAFIPSLIIITEEFLADILPFELVKNINLDLIVSSYNKFTCLGKMLLSYFWLKTHPTMFISKSKKLELTIILEAILVELNIKKYIPTKHRS